MHFSLIVALPGDTLPDGVDAALADAVNAYTDPDNAESVRGEWFWWVVGGLWRGSFVLKPDAVNRRRAGTLSIPIDTDFHLGGMPGRQIDFYETVARLGGTLPVTAAESCWEPLSPNEVDCARRGNIETDSLMRVPFYWIDLSGRLYDLHYDPDYVPATDINELRRRLESGVPMRDVDHLESANMWRYRNWVLNLSPETWLINLDVYR